MSFVKLTLDQKVPSDFSISGVEYHTHQVNTNRYENNDEIIIPVQDDLCISPSESYLYIEATLFKPDGSVSTSKFCNYDIAFLFTQIRYKLNVVIINTTKSSSPRIKESLIAIDVESR